MWWGIEYTTEMSWINAKLQQNNLFIVMPNLLHCALEDENVKILLVFLTDFHATIKRNSLTFYLLSDPELDEETDTTLMSVY